MDFINIHKSKILNQNHKLVCTHYKDLEDYALMKVFVP
jgi:hypothetical protein